MPEYTETEIPPAAKALFESAKEGTITPREFLEALQRIGITGIQAMFYLRKAFGLSFEAAKTLLIESEYGSTEAWAKVIEDSLDEIWTDSQGDHR